MLVTALIPLLAFVSAQTSQTPQTNPQLTSTDIEKILQASQNLLQASKPGGLQSRSPQRHMGQMGQTSQMGQMGQSQPQMGQMPTRQGQNPMGSQDDQAKVQQALSTLMEAYSNLQQGNQ